MPQAGLGAQPALGAVVREGLNGRRWVVLVSARRGRDGALLRWCFGVLAGLLGCPASDGCWPRHPAAVRAVCPAPWSPGWGADAGASSGRGCSGRGRFVRTGSLGTRCVGVAGDAAGRGLGVPGWASGVEAQPRAGAWAQASVIDLRGDLGQPSGSGTVPGCAVRHRVRIASVPSAAGRWCSCAFCWPAVHGRWPARPVGQGPLTRAT